MGMKLEKVGNKEGQKEEQKTRAIKIAGVRIEKRIRGTPNTKQKQ
jgi:hypothetical protein